MGVLNVTPDSFSDGGSYYRGQRLDVRLAVQRAEEMVLEGAAVIDIGGESTRPGAVAVSLQEELDRVIPVIEAVQGIPAVVSVDTSTPEVMLAAVSAGAAMINDVRALDRPGALAAASSCIEKGVYVCVMHMQGEPGSMQTAPVYEDVVTDVCKFLEGRIEACTAAGIPLDRVIVDPGFGFGKTLAHNLQLLAGLEAFSALEVPVLVGLSRKSMIGRLLGDAEADRVIPSVTLAMQAVLKGANIVRVHDVAETAAALAMVNAVNQAGNS